MARVTRRKFLKVSGAGALAAKAGGMAGILATGRAPAYAQTTTRALAALERLRSGFRSAAAQGDAARGREGARHQDQLRDRQRQRPAAAHHVGDPVGRRSRPDHAQQQPPAALCRELRRHVSDVAEALGKAEGGYYPLVKANSQRRQEMAVHAVGHHRRHDRLPQVVVRGGRRQRRSPTPGRSIARSARSSRPRAGRSARRSATPSATPRRSPIPFMWSWGGKEVEADGKTVAINSKETIESVKFMTGFWKDAHDEGGLAWDDSNNNRAFLSQTICGDAQRRLDLHRVAAQPRQVHDREGRAAEDRHPARAAAERPGRASSPCTPTTRTCCRPIPRTRRRPRTS